MSMNPFNWISWGSNVGSIDSLQAEQASIKAREDKLDQESRAKYGQAWSEQVDQHRAQEYADTVSSQVGTAFLQGAAEGARNEAKAVQSATSATLGWSLSMIPWQLWVAGAVFLFVYFDGWGHVQRRFFSK